MRIAEDVSELKELAAKTTMAQILRAIKLFGQLEIGFDNYLACLAIIIRNYTVCSI